MRIWLFALAPALVLGQGVDRNQWGSTDVQIARYQSQLKGNRNDPDSQIRLAAAYVQKRRETSDPAYLKLASKLIESVLKQDPTSYQARRLMVELELERHDFRTAAEYSRELIRLAPEDPLNWGTLGDALMETGQYDEAARAYQKMVDLRPGMASYSRVAWYRFITGDSEGAIEAMRKAVSAGSSAAENVAWCQVELGTLYFKGGRLREAEAAFAAALRTYPSYHRALAGMGMVKAAYRELPSAIQYYRKAQSATPLPEYSDALYDLQIAAGNRIEAIKQQQLVDMIDKMSQAESMQGDRTVAMIYADQDRHLDRALDLIRLELAVRADVYSYDAMAWVLYKNKRYEEAEKAIEQALTLGTPEPVFHYHAGMIAYARGKKEEAARQLKRALQLNPRFHVRYAPKAEQMLVESL